MSRWADLAAAGAAFAIALTAVPAAGRTQDEPVANRTPDAQDVAMTPITDLNLAKDEIPAVLLAATETPYASAGLTSCDAIAAAIMPLDATLGPDMDLAEQDNDRLSAGAVAKSVVASFIPFRGVIRELSGAAEHQRNFQAAVYAGAVRRGFLKGLGQQMGCPYPSRPAFTRVGVVPMTGPSATLDAPDEAGFVSQPVVQEIPAASGTPRKRRR